MKTAIVTGSSSGIGEEVTKLLLADDWKVYGLSRTQSDLRDDNFVWIECDLSKTSDIPLALQAVPSSNIDLLVSNAGVAFEELASDVTKESYERMFTINVLAPMLLVNTLKHKLAGATIISVSSVSDRLVASDFALYCSSKAANTRYFESLADEMKAAKVYCLLPDYVDTPMLRKLQDGRDFDWEGTIKISDIAQFSVDLASGKRKLESGSNIIIVTNSLVDDLESGEKLYGFNTNTKKLAKL